MSIEIKKVEKKSDLKKFIMFPWKIYMTDEHWVAPLIMDMKHRFDAKKNPYYEHAEVELFLALKNGKPVGRIACHIDKLHNDTHKEKAAFFGFFEVIEDYEVAKALYDHAVKWTKEKEMDFLRGPMSFGTNDECAFLLEGFDSDPAVMMPYNPKYYIDFSEKYGFIKAKDLLAFFKKSSDPIDPRLKRQAQRIENDPKIRVRKFSKKDFKKEMERVKEVYDAAWEPNWGFVPMTEKELDETAQVLLQYADTDLVWFAEEIHDDGTIEPIGVSVVLPNLNEATKPLNGRLFPFGIFKFMSLKKKVKGTRAILFGLKRKAQGFGVPTLLFWKTEEAGKLKGYEWVEMSWNLEDNFKINKFDTNLGGKVYKKYRIYDLKV
ncbi:GNAT family N-acetyltransferase [bacterium]|nr:GNAT family N-acetyltransferase [bacterium]